MSDSTVLWLAPNTVRRWSTVEQVVVGVAAQQCVARINKKALGYEPPIHLTAHQSANLGDPN
jgi:hypothetical protein